MFAASSAPIMEAAFGHLHNNGGAAFGGPPIVVESIMVDGEVANIRTNVGNVAVGLRQSRTSYDCDEM